MLIKVKTLTGKEIEIDIEPTDKVERIKERVEEKEGIPPPQQRLVFSGKSMNDDKTASDYKVTGGSVIHLVLALRGGYPPAPVGGAARRTAMRPPTGRIENGRNYGLVMVSFLFVLGHRHPVAGEGIVAYNCTHESVTSAEFSLLPNPPCPDFRASHVYEEDYVPLQLLQKKEFSDIHGYGMKVIRTLTIVRCDGVPVTRAYDQRVLKLDRTTVLKTYSSLLWKDDIMEKVGASPIPVVHNGTTRKARNLKGWTDDQEGYCGGSDFSLHGLEYVDSILQATYEILLYDGTMTVQLESNLVRTYSGTTCEYSEGHCEDYVYGDIFWDREEHDRSRCDKDTYVVLYEGKGIIRSYQETAVTEATKVVTVTDDSAAFSLIQTEKLLLCNQVAFRSEHPKLFIIELKHGLRFFQKKELHSLDLDLHAYRDSKFIHLERHLGQSIKELNANVMNKLCSLQSPAIVTLQSLAYTDAMEFAFAWKRKPGHSALVRGEVVHILDCVPVQVKVQPTSQCTHEIPVLYINDTLYMHPRSHVLSRYAETVPCTSLYPVKYRLKGAWYTLAPHLVASHPPQILRTKLNFTSWKYKRLNIGTVGIYSLADINRQRSAILFPVERRAITRQIADTAAGLQTGPRSFDLTALVDPSHFKAIIFSYWNELDNSIRIFGTYSGAILGVGFIYRICTTLCTGTLNGTAVTKMFGKCWGMLACLVPGIAHLALLYGKEEQQRTGKTRVSPRGAWNAYKNNKKPVDEVSINERELQEANGVLV